MQLLKFVILGLILVSFIYVTLNLNNNSSSTAQQELIDPVHVIDVRTTEEFQAGHYPGAKHIPLSEIASHLDQFNKDDGTYVLYCRSGNRSGQAINILNKHGIHNTINGINQATLPRVLGEAK